MAPSRFDTPVSATAPRGRTRSWWLTAGVVLLFALSVAARLAQWSVSNHAIALDAPYHVLNTIAAYQQTPLSVTHGLPIVTLGHPIDKHVPWGKTIPDKEGNFYYTSFPPLPFLLAFLVFTALGLPLTLHSLMLLNFGLHAMAMAIAAALGWRLSGCQGATRRTQESVAALCAIAYIWNTEALYAHGLLYWAHSLFQLPWMLQLFFLCGIIDPDIHRTNKSRKLEFAIFALVSFLAPAIEWSGYLANLGILILLIHARSERLRVGRAPLIVLVIATILAVVAFILPIASTLDVSTVLETLAARYRVRDSLHGKPPTIFIQLLIGYAESFGLYLLLVGGLIVLAVRQSWPSEEHRPTARPSPLAWIVLAAFPLLENLLLMQHATNYTFDRLKLLVVIVVALAVIFPQVARRGRSVITIAIAGSALFTLAQFAVATLVLNYLPSDEFSTEKIQLLPAYRRVWQSPELDSTRMLAARVAQYDDAVFAASASVRGFPCVTLQRNAYQLIPSLAYLDHLMAGRGANYGVWLVGPEDRSGICDWRQAIVRNRSQRTTRLLGVMSAAEAAAGQLVIAPEAMPYLRQATHVEIGERTIAVVQVDPQKNCVVLEEGLDAEATHTVYSISIQSPN